MSKTVFSGALLTVDGLDLSLSANQVAVDHEAEVPEVTAIGDTFRRRLAGGLKVSSIGASGFWQASPEDEDLFAAIGLADKVIIASPSATEGDVAYALQCVLGEYTPLQGAVGDVASFDLSSAARDDLLRGTLMNNGTVSASGAGTARNLGAVSAGQRVIAGVCVTGVNGTSPTLDLTVESDSADSFGGGESTRLTFSQFTGRGSEWQAADGAIADTWWRFAYTLGGTSPDFTWAGIIGIQ